MKQWNCFAPGMVAAAIVAVSDATAHADIVTLQVSGTLSPLAAPPPHQPPPESCASTGCILGGEIVINNTTGAVLSADVTATGFSPGAGPFTAPQALHTAFGLTDLEILTAPVFTSEAALIFSTPTAGSLVGYGWGLASGSLTEIDPMGRRIATIALAE